ncbi:regulator of G-protein signaling 9-binding protein isoform X2 [Denticeps clupeoides]|uniref:Regulator of G-protein signaling 9-binding protein-like n=2 Tax=Denticeps clupeoides TaxID=299321 RepID=A0AAY4EIG1_9TELE|nr:regulator of G-protein signaling 9-binding protein-like isoform X2 [Denticeps clupeoides]
MNRWRQSVGEIQARQRQVTECERAQVALSKVTACFQQMASSLGSDSDGSSLREELAETRALAHKICTGLHRRLLALLAEGEQGQEREHVERMWVFLLTGLETFQKDLKKVGSLQEFFPLTQRKDRDTLVKTGTSGGALEIAARVATIQTPWLAVEDDQIPDMKTQISKMDSLMQEMLQRVNVPLWSVEAKQEAWVEDIKDEPDQDETLEEMMQVELVSQEGTTSNCCHHPRCKLGCILCLLN